MGPYAISAYHHQCCEFESHSDMVYSIQHYVMDFSVTCGRSVVFFRYFDSSTNKTDHHDITEILLKVALNTITLALIIDLKADYKHKVMTISHMTLWDPIIKGGGLESY